MTTLVLKYLYAVVMIQGGHSSGELIEALGKSQSIFKRSLIFASEADA